MMDVLTDKAALLSLLDEELYLTLKVPMESFFFKKKERLWELAITGRHRRLSTRRGGHTSLFSFLLNLQPNVGAETQTDS
jgi:hypothetical protein